MHGPRGSEVLGRPVVVAAAAVLQYKKEKSFPITGWLRGLQLSPRQHHFSSPKSQARNVCKLQYLDLLQKENIFTMKEQGNVLVPSIWMSLLEAKRRNIMQYRGQACLNEADPTATQDNSRLSLTSKEAESYPRMQMITNSKSLQVLSLITIPTPKSVPSISIFFQVSLFLKFYVPKC